MSTSREMATLKSKLQEEQQLKHRTLNNHYESGSSKPFRGVKGKGRAFGTRVVQLAVVIALAIVGLQTSFQMTHDDYKQDETYDCDPNQPSFAFKRFTTKGQGFFNQQMAFAGSVIALNDHVHSMSNKYGDYYQILLSSLNFIDYLGLSLIHI